jgi:hypothetical protein
MKQSIKEVLSRDHDTPTWSFIRGIAFGEAMFGVLAIISGYALAYFGRVQDINTGYTVVSIALITGSMFFLAEEYVLTKLKERKEKRNAKTN